MDKYGLTVTSNEFILSRSEILCIVRKQQFVDFVSSDPNALQHWRTINVLILFLVNDWRDCQPLVSEH